MVTMRICRNVVTLHEHEDRTKPQAPGGARPTGFGLGRIPCRPAALSRRYSLAILTDLGGLAEASGARAVPARRGCLLTGHRERTRPALIVLALCDPGRLALRCASGCHHGFGSHFVKCELGIQRGFQSVYQNG